MPIYEYRCLECRGISEIFLHSLNSQYIQCPVGGRFQLDKLLSASYTLMTDSYTTSVICCGKTVRCEAPSCSLDNTCRGESK